MTKIAVCFTGNMRNFKDTYLNFEKYLLCYPNVDVFLYGCENKEGRTKNIDDFTSLYKPKKIVINEKNFYDQISNQYEGLIKSFAPQFYNVRECFKLVKEYEKESKISYDIIIRMRLDCFLFREITTEEIKEAKEGKVLLPDEWSCKHVHPRAETDMFYLGNKENYEIYSSLYDNLNLYHPKYNNLASPETITGNYLFDKNINIKHIDRHFVYEYFNSNPEIEPKGFVALGDWKIPDGWNEHNYRKYLDL